MSQIRIAAIIPARMASTRYPGKPLLEIHGLPMIEHVRRRTFLCNGFSDVVVATCDEEILHVIEEYGGTVIKTSSNHIMASDRVAEAAEKLDCTHVVNVQGDEILILPEDLKRMIDSIQSNPDRQYWNAIARIESNEELGDALIVKCVFTQSEKIIYCSRDFSHLQLIDNFEPIRKIIGVLGYSCEGLLNYSQLLPTPIERIQSIDQSRIIEHDIPLMGVPFSAGYPGINNKREEEVVRQILRTDSRQKEVLKQILY
jgi:3-deoxy-manno-octulosonate cytidylyltransferase (CMP-KDO synthetase)